MIKNKLKLLLATALLYMFYLNEASAVTLNNPLRTNSIMGVIDDIIVGLRDIIAPPIVALAVLFGGFQMLFSGGNPETFAKGKKTLMYAVIGYVIILVASGISGILEDLVG